MLKVKNISIQYQNNIILNDTSMTFKEGTLTAIIGKSGSGKTSILNVLALENIPKNMQYEIDFKEDSSILKRYRIAYLKQGDNFIQHISCIENMKLIASIVNQELDSQKIEAILNKVQLTIDKKTYPNNLSGGEKQRFALALALVKNADILLCDEITASLDEQNVQGIMDILKDLAHNDHKTVIITSHNEDMYLQSDVIYEIKDKQLYKVKDNDINTSLQPSSNIHFIPLKIKSLFQYNLNKMKKRKLITSSYLTLVSLIVSIVSVSLFAGGQFSNQLNKMLDIIQTHQSYIINSSSSTGAFYDLFAQAINNDQLEDIKQIESIKEIMPYLVFEHPDQLYTTRDFNNKEELGNIMTLNVYTSPTHFDTIEFENWHFSLQSYYHEEDMDYSCVEINKDIDGIYLRNDIALALGISDISSPIEVEFDIYVPILSKITSSNYRIPIYKKVTIKEYVRGILHPAFSHFYGNTMYMSYDKMNSIYEELLDTAPILEGYEPYLPSIYSIYTKDKTNIEDLQNQLTQIDSHLYVHNSGESLNQSMSPLLETEHYYKTYSTILFVIVVVISIVYSILSQKDYRKEYSFLTTWGVTKKELHHSLWVESLLTTLMTFILSTGLYVAIMFVLKNQGRIIINTLNYDLILFNIIHIAILSILTSCLSHFTLFFINRKKG